jgi:hypothetical protein
MMCQQPDDAVPQAIDYLEMELFQQCLLNTSLAIADEPYRPEVREMKGSNFFC